MRPCLSWECDQEKRELRAQLVVAEERIRRLRRHAAALEDRLHVMTVANHDRDVSHGGGFTDDPPPLLVDDERPESAPRPRRRFTDLLTRGRAR